MLKNPNVRFYTELDTAILEIEDEGSVIKLEVTDEIISILDELKRIEAFRIEYYKQNHQKVGEALKVKLTPQSFKSKRWADTDIDVQNGTEFSIEQLMEQFDLNIAVPIVIDEEAVGDYDVICEYGTEVRYFNDPIEYDVEVKKWYQFWK